MTFVGTFRIDVTVSNFRDRARSHTLAVLVDTGATYTTLPRDVVEALGCEPAGVRRVRLADGREETWPVSIVSVEILGQDGPTFCLVPVTSYLCCA